MDLREKKNEQWIWQIQPIQRGFLPYQNILSCKIGPAMTPLIIILTQGLNSLGSTLSLLKCLCTSLRSLSHASAHGVACAIATNFYAKNGAKLLQHHSHVQLIRSSIDMRGGRLKGEIQNAPLQAAPTAGRYKRPCFLGIMHVSRGDVTGPLFRLSVKMNFLTYVSQDRGETSLLQRKR